MATLAPGPSTEPPPEPVWTPEPVAEVVPPRIPNWDRSTTSASWPDARWEHSGAPTFERRPALSEPLDLAHDQDLHRQGGRSRTFIAVTVLVSLFVVFAAVAGVTFLLHSSPPAASKSSTHAVSAAAVFPDTAHLRAATASAEAATAGVQTELRALDGFPTPANVAAVINPYIASLQRYKTILSGAVVAGSALSAVDSARATVTEVLLTLGTIDGLAPLRLGSYLDRFSEDAPQLRTTLTLLSQRLRPPTN